MLWVRKRPDARASAECDPIVPAPLPVELDAGLFARHLSGLQKAVEPEGGIESCLNALDEKHRRFAAALDEAALGGLSLGALEGLLSSVFTARRRVFRVLEAMGEDPARAAVTQLLRGSETLVQRMRAFADSLPVPPGEERDAVVSSRRIRRAGWDFAAELLHFSDPLRYPLMTRWVWDEGTMSGALREFVHGHEPMPRLPLDNRPETFEGVRRWLVERIAEQGVYRHLHFWADLVQAQAYTTYLRSVAEGNLGGDFGRAMRPGAQLCRLLGIGPRGAALAGGEAGSRIEA